MEIKITHIEGHPEGKFVIEQNDKQLGELVYAWRKDTTLVILHTEVSDQLAGLGYGKKLVQVSVEFARSKGYSILPVCPFAKALFRRLSPEWDDVLQS
ncbi:MAG: N-acetyltransferase [Bacteroidia bacterium]|nr:N-acetyltransferase [Bacteroidia bacterium]